jgi:hypothetical protein
MLTAAPAKMYNVCCPTCGRLMYRIRGGTGVTSDQEGRTTWSDPIEVEFLCRLCRNIVTTGNDRPPRVGKRNT